MILQFWVLSQNPPLFQLKLVYSYVIEVADSESDLGLYRTALVSEIFAFYHLENARGRPGRRGHVHLDQNFLMFLRFIRVFEGFEGFDACALVSYCDCGNQKLLLPSGLESVLIRVPSPARYH